jgi:NAD(P)-dependent dehydrogenase (short-subunit alcohol dehydrogenase family)
MHIIGSDCVVTGGAGGIGRGLMERLVLHEGAHMVACVDLPQSKIYEVVTEINQMAGREAVLAFPGNAADPEFIWSVFNSFTDRSGGPPEILVNLMGRPLDALMESYKPGKPPKVFPMERLNENLLVNAAAPAEWACVFAYLHDKYRIDNGMGNWVDKGGPEQGVVVFVESVSAEAGIVGQLGYGMAKNALVGAYKVFKSECYERLGLRPVLINPGFIETPMVTSMGLEEQQAVLQNVPSHSFITVPGIVEIFVYAIKCDSISAPVSAGAGYACPPRLYRTQPVPVESGQKA